MKCKSFLRFKNWVGAVEQVKYDVKTNIINIGEQYRFRVDKLFDVDATNQQIFENCGPEAIEGIYVFICYIINFKI